MLERAEAQEYNTSAQSQIELGQLEEELPGPATLPELLVILFMKMNFFEI